MHRRAFLTLAALSSLSFLTSGCRGPRRKARRRGVARRAVRRHRRRRRRFRRFVRRRVRRGGRKVHVVVVPVHVQEQDVVHLEDHGECQVTQIEEERMEVQTEGGETVWVDVLVEGDDEGEELAE